MSNHRKIEVDVRQGHHEKVAYGFNWVAVGTPANPVVVLEEEATSTDVSATKLEVGAPSISDAVVTTPRVINLVAGIVYRLMCQVTIDGNIYEAYLLIIGER